MDALPLEPLLLGVPILILLGSGIWYFWPTSKRQSRTPLPDHLPKGLNFSSQALLTQEHATFYNLLRLAVEDQYLVFAQVPLWSLVSVSATNQQDEGKALSFMNRISKQRIDFVLIHPGTLSPEKVIELEKETGGSESRAMRTKLVQQVFDATGIECIRLDGQQTFTVQSLGDLVNGNHAEG